MADAPRSATPAAAPEPPEDRPLSAGELRELRRFHRHGGSPEEAAGAAEAATYVPPALAAFRGQPVRSDYPLFLAAGDEGEVICRPLPALLAELAPKEPRSLADNLVRLERAVRERVGAGAAGGPGAVGDGNPSPRGAGGIPGAARGGEPAEAAAPVPAEAAGSRAKATPPALEDASPSVSGIGGAGGALPGSGPAIAAGAAKATAAASAPLSSQTIGRDAMPAPAPRVGAAGSEAIPATPRTAPAVEHRGGAVPRLQDPITGPPIPAAPVLAEAAAAVLSEIRLPAAEADAFAAGLAALREALPPDGVFVPFDAGAPLALLAAAAVGRREAARAGVLAEARALAANAADLLAIDQAAANGRRGAALEASLGALGGRFLRADALAEVGEARRGGTALAAERLAGLAAARTALDAFCAAPPAPRLFVAEADAATAGAVALDPPEATGVPAAGRRIAGAGEPSAPDLLGISPGAAPEPAPFGTPGSGRPPCRPAVPDTSLAAWRIETAADPAAAAAAAWDEEAERALDVVRALHRVRLEVARDFDPEQHEGWLENLAWEDLGPDELALATPVAAVVSPGELLGGGLPSLSRLLLSGRPVQVVVPVDPGRLDDPEGRTGFRFEPAFLGVAHREVFVQQGSVARPEALLDGFRHALAGPRPGLHVVAAPPPPAGGRSSGLDPWLLASAAVEGRAHPLFAYDPGAGLSWARRLDFRANPEPEADWVTHEPPAGTAAALPAALPFTAADALLLADPAAARPAPGAGDDLVPLADWLALDPAAASRRLPFVWAADRRGRLARLVVTRRLALAARDRLAFWHLLQELGGVRNEHVEEARRAAAAAAAETAAAERRKLADEHAAEIERVRRDAAAEAVDRLVAALFELDPRELGAPPGASVAALGLPADVDRLAAALLDAARGAAGPAPATGAAVPEDPQVAALAGELLAAVESEDVPPRGAAR